MPRGTKWCAITYLGGPEGRWRAQIGKAVMFGDSQTTVLDLLATLDERVRGKLSR
jgi:hypothetical protein